jgi:hypothetical protein
VTVHHFSFFIICFDLITTTGGERSSKEKEKRKKRKTGQNKHTRKSLCVHTEIIDR